MCGSRKYPFTPNGRSLEILRGREVVKAKLLGEEYEAKLEFPGEGGGGLQYKKHFCGGEYGYFLELHYLNHGVVFHLFLQLLLISLLGSFLLLS